MTESEFAMRVASAAMFKQLLLQKLTGKTSIGKNELRDMLDELMDDWIQLNTSVKAKNRNEDLIDV